MILTRQSPRAAHRSAFTLMEVLVVVAILVVLAGVGGTIFLRVKDDTDKDAARLKAKALGEACFTYARAHSGEMPANLSVLANPGDGSRPYVEASMLSDPWNRPWNYAAQATHATNVSAGKPDIWSTGSDGTQQLGNWPEGE